jgi:hypothetical protein
MSTRSVDYIGRPATADLLVCIAHADALEARARDSGLHAIGAMSRDAAAKELESGIGAYVRRRIGIALDLPKTRPPCAEAILRGVTGRASTRQPACGVDAFAGLTHGPSAAIGTIFGLKQGAGQH